MKTLLRTSILALLVFAGYSAFSTPVDQSNGVLGPMSPAPCAPGAAVCAK